jgi:RNA polymerase sigma-70 factor (ECF subfamily)
VKAALNRARTKLSASSPPTKAPQSASPELKKVMQLYVERFNSRDWDGVRELISADARLNVIDRFAGKFADAPYFFNYNNWPWAWKLALGEIEGEPVIIILQRGADTWTTYSVIRMDVAGDKVGRIIDYIHCPWLIESAESVSTFSPTLSS